MKIAVPCVVLSMVVLPSWGSSLEAKEIEREFHESFDVSEGMRLRLTHGDGDVVVEPWDRDVLDVRVYYRSDVRSFGLGVRDPDFTVDFAQRGDEIVVTGRETGRSGIVIGFHSSRRYQYTYTIKAPSYLELDLVGDDGDVRISGWQGNIEISLDDGDVDLKDLRAERVVIEIEDGEVTARGLDGEFFLTGDDGDLLLTESKIGWARIRVEDGDVEITKSEGDFDLVLEDGDVRLRAVKAGNLDIRSSDGDIFVDLLLGDPPDINLETDDGRVELGLRTGTSARFSIHTDDGRISLDLPSGTDIDEHDGNASGDIGGGEGRIRIRTSDGNVILRETGGAS